MQQAVGAPVEEQGTAVGIGAEVEHPGDDDAVVPAVVLGPQLAVDPRDDVVEDR